MSNSGYSGEESLFFDEEPNRKRNRIIGFVRITFEKEILRRHLHILLFKSILMGIVLGYIVYKTRNLYSSLIAHIAFNVASFTLAFLGWHLLEESALIL